MRTTVLLALLVAVSCGPSRDDLARKDALIEELNAENAKLKSQVSTLQQQLSDALETPENILARAQQAFNNKDFRLAADTAGHLLAKYPNAPAAMAAKRITQSARRRLAESEAASRAEAEREQQRVRAAERTAEKDRSRAVRADLDRNLNGKGDGFVIGWKWSGDTFVLVIDRSRYRENIALAAAMTARTIFETDNVPLPKHLVFRDENGDDIDSGPFSNVPSVTQ